MDELTWEMIEEVNGRLEAELIESLLKAQGIEVELFQEAVGHLAFPVTVNGLGRVQIFVPKKKARQARILVKSFRNKEDRSI